MKQLLYIIVLLSATGVSAQPGENNNKGIDSVYTANAGIQVHNLNDYTSVFIDSSNKLSIEEIASGKFNDRFQPLSAIVQPAQPYLSYWLRFSIASSGNIDKWWLLLNVVPDSIKNRADNLYVDGWFLNSANQVIEHQRTGLFVPRSQKAIKENPALNRLSFSVRKGETRNVYLKVYNEYEPALIMSPQLQDPVIGIPGGESRMPYIILSTAAFVFSIISFFFFFFVKEKAYLFFAFYTFSLSQHYLLLDPGLAFVDFYIPEQPQLATPIFTLLAVGGFILFALFGRYFINLPQLSKRLDAVFKWTLAVWTLYLITIVTVVAVTHHSIPDGISIIFIFLFLIFLVRIVFFKTILVRFFVAGALWLLIFTVLGLLWNSSVLSLPFNPWPIGQVGQLLIYAAGLAYKVRLNEKARTQADMIRLRNVELANLYAESKKQKEEIEIQKKNADEALVELKAAQAQLIQNEKMASLGELTAGIAHEIKNPLNFVNNFSEVNTELIDEMLQEIEKGKLDDVKTIATTIKDNQEKITYHGKRADDIVKSMLQHSRSSTGIKEPTNINALAEEYLRLAYHGLRAKDKSFNAVMKTDFDDSIGNINIIPQDIGRVILNLITNAFYAVTEKMKQVGDEYEPTVSVGTKSINGIVEVTVTDNGNGIPKSVLDKIFQPFFTTKPTGQGTGLGLSLSYDIVKAHGGEIKVVTKEGEGSDFVISLPIK